MYKFKIESMHCMSCFRNIQDALQEFDTDIKIEPQIQDRLLVVDSGHNIEEISKILADAGYPVTAVIEQ